MLKRLLIVFFLLASTTFAKTHKDDFDVPCDRLWSAVRQVVMHSGKYGVLFMSNEEMTTSYNIGGTLGGKRTNTVQLRPNGTGCTMNTQTAFSGLVHNDAADFLRRVKDALAENVENVASKNPEPTAQKPSTQDRSDASKVSPQQAATATLEISSTPAGADIELDGNFTGNTPSSVGVAPGEHTVKITKRGYGPWLRKLTTTNGTVRMSAELDPLPENVKAPESAKAQPE